MHLHKKGTPIRTKPAEIDNPQLRQLIKRADIGSVDLQLINALASDEAASLDRVMTLIKGVPHYRHRNLKSQLSSEFFSAIFSRVLRLIMDMARGKDCILFLRGPPTDFDADEFEEHYSISAYCDNGLLNGTLQIVRLPSCELLGLKNIWGDFASVRGVALDPEISTSSILAHCSLSCPQPTTLRSFDQREIGHTALVSMLPHVSFFFEEVDNSRCLRILSARMKDGRLFELIEAILHSTSLA